jgi:hypothetical protein
LNPEVKAAWLEALRSTRFLQGKHQLCKLTKDATRHCCLGVLCELFIEQGGDLSKGPPDRSGTLWYGDQQAILPSKVVAWAGLSSNTGELPGEDNTLASLNDGGTSFAEIADTIEAKL